MTRKCTPPSLMSLKPFAPGKTTGTRCRSDTERDTPSSACWRCETITYEQASLLRVLFVCFVTPLPAFAAVILIECIPLASPSKGWRANYAFWIRLFLSSFPMAVGGVLQVKQVVAPGILSNRATLLIGLGTAVGYVSCAITLAAVWTFPVPFGYVLMVVPFVLFFMSSFCAVVGPKIFSIALRQQIIPPLSVLAAEGALAGCYPPFYAVFRQLAGFYQTSFVVILPIIKVLSKQYIAKASAHLQECMGPTIIFSVDVCNILYSVICMQTAVSSVTSIFMIGSDAFFLMMVLRTIYYQINPATVWPENASIQTRRRNYLQTLPVLVRQVFQHANPHTDSTQNIRLCAPFPLPLAADSKELMTELCCATTGNTSTFAGSPASPLRRGSSLPDVRYHSLVGDLRVETLPNQAFEAETRKQQASCRGSLKTKWKPGLRPLKVQVASRSISVKAISKLKVVASVIRISSQTKPAAQEVQDALQALFHSEYVMMGEYVECILPMLYVVYLAVLCQLPTAAHYPHMHSLTPDKLSATLGNLMLFSLVELTSFLGVSVLLKRKFGFSPLYQLAFVLETQARALQSQLLIWVMSIVQFTLVHNGVNLDNPLKKMEFP